MVAGFSAYDLWRTACPEHEDADDYREVVERFVARHADEIDQVLELCQDLNRAGEEEGLDSGEFPGCIVAEFLQNIYPGFKKTDRIATFGKQKAGAA